MSSVAQSTQSVTDRENPLEPHLLALYRVATPEQKLTAVMRLNHVLQGLKEAQLTVARPEWSGAQRQAELRRWWLSARD